MMKEQHVSRGGKLPGRPGVISVGHNDRFGGVFVETRSNDLLHSLVTNRGRVELALNDYAQTGALCNYVSPLIPAGFCHASIPACFSQQFRAELLVIDPASNISEGLLSKPFQGDIFDGGKELV